MPILSDNIEVFIKSLIGESTNKVNIQRNDLASYFNCAPSQINYVIKTRFNIDNGYYTESRRGGGGYISIIKVESSIENYISYLIKNSIGNSIKQRDAFNMAKHIYEKKLISVREYAIMCSALRSQSIMAPIEIKDIIRASILKAMLITTLRLNSTKQGD